MSTYLFMPDALGGRRIVPSHMSYAVSRLVTGHGQLNGKWFDMRMIDSDRFSYGERETAERMSFSNISFMTTCPIFQIFYDHSLLSYTGYEHPETHTDVMPKIIKKKWVFEMGLFYSSDFSTSLHSGMCLQKFTLTKQCCFKKTN
ncbi:hypothetical protein O3M35_007031 [Rhynocoris fuscipes]|uniref:Uncharacterized protein n=1 Tax=Rhynocoris fuscipes TaxID=488301 RepID=A0AAW1DIB8_9HEMI